MLLWIVHSGDHLNARARLCIEVHFREEHRSDWPIFGRGEVQPDSGRVARIRSDIEGALDPSRLLVLSLYPPSRVKTETNESLSTIYLSTRRTASTCALRRALSDIARGNNFGETRLASSASPNQILVANCIYMFRGATDDGRSAESTIAWSILSRLGNLWRSSCE